MRRMMIVCAAAAMLAASAGTDVAIARGGGGGHGGGGHGGGGHGGGMGHGGGFGFGGARMGGVAFATGHPGVVYGHGFHGRPFVRSRFAFFGGGYYPYGYGGCYTRVLTPWGWSLRNVCY